MAYVSTTILSRPKRNKVYTTVYTDISNGKDNLPDIAVVVKYDDNNISYRVIIIRVRNTMGIFDLDDLIKRDIYTILNYQVLKSPGDAYDEMMSWLGKLCKKPISSRYFKKSDPYKRDILNTGIYNKKLIKYIKDNVPV